MPETTTGLTTDEQLAIDLAGTLWGVLCRIVGHGPTRDADLAELIAPIHLIQRYVGSQAAARAHPHEFRLLGETLHTGCPHG